MRKLEWKDLYLIQLFKPCESCGRRFRDFLPLFVGLKMARKVCVSCQKMKIDMVKMLIVSYSIFVDGKWQEKSK